MFCADTRIRPVYYYPKDSARTIEGCMVVFTFDKIVSQERFNTMLLFQHLYPMTAGETSGVRCYQVTFFP